MNSNRASGWQAELALMFGAAGGKTVLATQRHVGPLLVQRPFYPEGDEICHVYIIHPPGGIVGGDELRLTADVRPQAHALLTTPAATKFYRSAGPVATQTQQITVRRGGAMEWLPQETLVYNEAHARLMTRIELETGANFIGWDVVCFGLPASDQPFQSGEFRPAFEIYRDGEPLFIERGRYAGGSPIMTAGWGLAGRLVVGTMVCVTSERGLLDAVRRLEFETNDGEICAATFMDDLLVCRYVGHEAFRAFRYFQQAWALLRPAVLRRNACPPRIWKT